MSDDGVCERGKRKSVCESEVCVIISGRYSVCVCVCIIPFYSGTSLIRTSLGHIFESRGCLTT